jgi:hypothetical protein
VRLLKTFDEGFVFLFSPREKVLFLAVLKLYPRLPRGYSKLSRSSEAEASNQALLEEALEEQRSENQRQVRKLLADPVRWKHSDHGWQLTVTGGELEWLLQVLNDIRLGSWVRLGSPEDKLQHLTEETAPHAWAMEVAGAFEITLLQAIGSDPGLT